MQQQHPEQGHQQRGSQGHPHRHRWLAQPQIQAVAGQPQAEAGHGDEQGDGDEQLDREVHGRRCVVVPRMVSATGA